MNKIVENTISQDLEMACSLHQRATSDYKQCQEFNKLMSKLLARFEEKKDYDMADKVMAILLDCNPKAGAHCEKSSSVAKRITRLKETYT